MYVVTFYSFKGGTGRSMALINTAVELVKNGRRVLIVDFDLEAPGLDTFNLPRPQTPTPGIVDFVLEYLETSIAPDISQFVYKSPVVTTNGQLWVMPAGVPDANYDDRFKSIDWQDLYEKHDGYLLFEDLRLQWERVLQPDYVFIDSRTGHTDVGGICTRQLPDAVALFFFPNEQNRRGLESVVRQIRQEGDSEQEEDSERKRQIHLHFVMSNVPDLDDEQSFLAKSLQNFRESLGFDRLDGVIHNYPSLALLTQSIFTQDRPRTRLANEYRQLAKAIQHENIADPSAAVDFLEEIAPRSIASRVGAKELEDRIQEIRKYHSDKPEVLLPLARFLRRDRKFDEALSLLEEAGKLGAASSEFLLTRAELNLMTGRKAAASEDITRFLAVSGVPYVEVRAATQLLTRLDPTLLRSLPNSPAFRALDAQGQFHVSQELFSSRDSLTVAEMIMHSLLQRDDLGDLCEAVEIDLSLALIGQRKYSQAISELTHDGQRTFEELDTHRAFNVAIAQWGLDQFPQPTLFERVLTIPPDKGVGQPNYQQCLAVAYWVTGDTESALKSLGQAIQQITARPRPMFSSWSYLRLSPKDFQSDIREMEDRIVNDESLMPRFFSEPNGNTLREALQ